MFTVLDKATNATHPVQDGELLNELKSIFPDQNKHFYEAIKTRITLLKYWSNNQFTITHHLYDPSKTELVIKKKLVVLKDIPKNISSIKREINYNQWLLFNSENGKSCVFNNLAALARCMNIDYSFLYCGICKRTVFAVGKYRFSRNTMAEKDHCMSLLSEVL